MSDYDIIYGLLSQGGHEVAWDYCLQENICLPSEWARINTYTDVPSCNISETHHSYAGAFSFSGSGLRDQYSIINMATVESVSANGRRQSNSIGITWRSHRII